MTSLVPSSLRSRWLAAARGARSVGFGNPAQERLLAAILKGFPSGDVVSATIGAPPTPDFKAFPAIGEVGETWLYVTVKANDRDYGTFFANWEAQLVAGAFREASWRMQLPNLLGVTTTAEYPDGGKSEPWSAAIAAPFGKRTLSAQAALANVDARIKADHRFSTSSVSIIRPLDGAPILTVTLSEAASVARGESMALAVFGDLEQYEGSFVKVVDSSGSVVRVAGYATFTGIGVGASPTGGTIDGVQARAAP